MGAAAAGIARAHAIAADRCAQWDRPLPSCRRPLPYLSLPDLSDPAKVDFRLTSRKADGHMSETNRVRSLDGVRGVGMVLRAVDPVRVDSARPAVGPTALVS